MLTNANLPRLHSKQCKSILEKARWNNEFDKLTPTCPYCGSKRIGRHIPRYRKTCLQCRCCIKSFTILTGTFLQSVKLDKSKIINVLFFDFLSENCNSSYLGDLFNIDRETIKRLRERFKNALLKRDCFARNLSNEFSCVARYKLKIKII